MSSSTSKASGSDIDLLGCTNTFQTFRKKTFMLAMNYIMVAIGGAAGALARYQANLFFQQTGLQLPYATLFVNVSGSIFFAAVLFLLGEKLVLSEHLRLLLLVGFAGAFTTFSTFSYEMVSLFQSGLYVMALIFIAANVVLSLCAFALTFYLATKLFV